MINVLISKLGLIKSYCLVLQTTNKSLILNTIRIGSTGNDNSWFYYSYSGALFWEQFAKCYINDEVIELNVFRNRNF